MRHGKTVTVGFASDCWACLGRISEMVEAGLAGEWHTGLLGRAAARACYGMAERGRVYLAKPGENMGLVTKRKLVRET